MTACTSESLNPTALGMLGRNKRAWGVNGSQGNHMVPYRLHNVIVGMFDGGTDVTGVNAKTNARSRSGSAIAICLPSVQEP